MQLSRFYYVLIAALLCFGPVNSNAEYVAPVRSIERFSIDNGLSQSSVQCLYVDKTGFLWVGTQDGLNRYDGYSFKIYRNRPMDSTSISNNYIHSISEDSKGNLWVATQGGLCRYNRTTDNFSNFFNNPLSTNSISNNTVYYVYVDRYDKVWVKTNESIDCFDPIKESVIRYKHYIDPFNYSVRTNNYCIFEDIAGRLWVGTKDGLNILDKKRRIFKHFTSSSNPNSISSNRITSVFEDSKGRLWVTTENGINLYNSQSESFQRFYPASGIGNSGWNTVNFLYESKRGDLWLGSEEGIATFNPANGTIHSYDKVLSTKQVSVSNTVTSIVEDANNNLWIGTFQGLVKLDYREPKFKTISTSSSGDPLFGNNLVASLYADDDLLSVGTWGSGLYFCNKKGTVVKHFSAKSGQIVNDYIHSIFKTSWGDVLYGTRGGLMIYDKKRQRMVDFFLHCKIPFQPVFLGNRINAIREDSVGNLWFGTTYGLFRYNGQGVERIDRDRRDSLILTNSDIRSIAVGHRGEIWVGTADGLNCYSSVNGAVKKYKRKEPYTGKGLLNDMILSLLVDSRGSIWVGTAAGLNLLDGKGLESKQFTTSDGLPSDLIYTIEEDSWGMIWISTNRGIAKIEPESNAIQKFDIHDGLQSYEYNVGASCKAKSGELFFGGINGLNTFFPDSIKINDTPPRLAFSTFKLYTHSGVTEIPVIDGGLNLVTKDCNFFIVEFASLDFSKPSKNHYRYILEGFDNQWVDLGAKNLVSFTNLSPGTYTLRVQGTNADGVWNLTGISTTIVIETDFWNTQLARWLYVVLIILGSIFFLWYRTRGLRESRRLLHEREAAIAEVQKQKEELVVKNKSITDSITYAKRIQEALLPSKLMFKKIIPQSFILYMPKDIVSGDFYWINETKDKIFVAVVDCTGHGVPGAFMSIIGFELLRNITTIQKIDDAAEILNRLNKGVNETFSSNDEDATVKDGMDVAFCVIDKKAKRMQFSGAFNNMYIVRDNKILEVKGDRFAVGLIAEGEHTFSSEFIDLQTGDMLYMFTDGFVDQFGGPEGKKYKFRRFRHLLLNIHNEPVDVQHKMLVDSISEWCSGYEQVDDILIIGINPQV